MLIDSLIEYRKRTGHEITVVFDGWRSGQGQESRSVLGGIKIVYSRLGEKADEVIKRIISSEKKEYIVVTSDREIANHAWASGCIPVPSDEFLDSFGRGRYASDKEEADDDEYPEQPRKGNPRQLSKKEKALRKAKSRL
jgi:uncharacterized protein